MIPFAEKIVPSEERNVGTNEASLPRAFARKASEMKGRPLFRRRFSGKIVTSTWDEVRGRITGLAAALIRRGFSPGSRAAVMADNGPDWAVVDFAVQSAGGIVVPIYTTSSGDQIRHILEDSASICFFVGSKHHLACVLPVVNSLEKKPTTILLDGTPEPGAEAVVDYLGDPPTDSEKKEVENRIASLSRDDTSAVIYTSGTTGPPKGVILTHGNILSNIEGAWDIFSVSEEDVLLSVLPMSHSFERTTGYYGPLLAGAVIHFARSPGTFAKDILEARPTIVMLVPRFLEKMRQKIIDSVARAPGLSGIAARAALRAGLAEARLVADGKSPSFLLGLASSLSRKIVGGRFRKKLGGRVKTIFSGGAALSREVWAFFRAAGISVTEGYGLTESSPVISCNPPHAVKPGSVGKPISGHEVRIAGDGEILFRGPSVMKGYYNLPEETDAVIDAEGFLHTGDVGFLDEEGYLFITDRKKDIIVSASGKNISPQNVENRLCLSPLIEFACVFGEGENFLVALLSPDLEALSERAGRDGIDVSGGAGALEHPAVKEIFRAEVDSANAELAAYERIFRFHLAHPPFSTEGGEITTTLKVRRKIVAEKYAAEIKGLFRP